MRAASPEIAYSRYDPPFPDGGTASLAGGRYKVTNNGQRISLFESSGGSLDTLELHPQVAKLRERLAATGKVIGSAEVRRPQGIMYWLPTLPAMNDFAAERMRGLNTAGIKVEQSEFRRDTPSPIYAVKLGGRKMDMGRGPWQHVHDMFVHWLGAAGLHETPYAAFAELCQRADSLGAKYPSLDDGDRAFASSVSEGFEESTACSLSAMRRGVKVHPSSFLLGYTLSEIATRCPPGALAEATSVIVAHHLGEPVATRVEGTDPVEFSFVVPWEVDNLPRHYELVADRLQQEPTNPLSYLPEAA